MVATGQPAAPATWRPCTRCPAAPDRRHPRQHPGRLGSSTSSMSAADLIASSRPAPPLRLRPPQAPTNDHLIFSKGHASPLLYALYLACGAIDDAELMTTGHWAPGSRVTPPDHPVGGRGHRVTRTGAPDRSGVALAGKYLDRLPTGSGCCAVTASWPRGRSGRRSTRQAIPAGQPDRDRGCEPARAAWRDRVRWEMEIYRRRVEPSAAVPWSSTATTWRRSTAPSSTPGDGRPADVILAKTIKARVLEIENKEGGMGGPAPGHGGASHRPAR